MLVTLDSNFFHENLLEKKISPEDRKFRSSRGSETRRKLDSVKWVVGLDSNFFGGCFWTVTFFGDSASEYEYPANRKKKQSPRDRKFRWYKYDQEGLKRIENWFL